MSYIWCLICNEQTREETSMKISAVDSDPASAKRKRGVGALQCDHSTSVITQPFSQNQCCCVGGWLCVWDEAKTSCLRISSKFQEATRLPLP